MNTYDESRILRLTLNSAIPRKKRERIEEIVFSRARLIQVDIIIDSMPLNGGVTHTIRYGFGMEITPEMQNMAKYILANIPTNLLRMKEKI